MEESSLKENIIIRIAEKFNLKSYNLKQFEKFTYPKHIPLFSFDTQQYKIDDLGNMCILQGKSIIGMYILTTVLTPQKGIDLPIVIIDLVFIKNKITVFVEFFTNNMKNENNKKLLEEKLIEKRNKYAYIENYEEKYNWYVPLRNIYSPLKRGSKKDIDKLEKMVEDYLQMYLDYVISIEKNDNIENEKLDKFIEDLIVKGNPSSEILEKALGKEDSQKFSRQVIFYRGN